MGGGGGGGTNMNDRRFWEQFDALNEITPSPSAARPMSRGLDSASGYRDPMQNDLLGARPVSRPPLVTNGVDDYIETLEQLKKAREAQNAVYPVTLGPRQYRGEDNDGPGDHDNSLAGKAFR